MKRSDFIKTIVTGAIGVTMMDLKTFGNQVLNEKSTERMPALFIGHGSPMNAIQQNKFTEALAKTGKEIPHPKAILVVSAHWQTRGTFVTVAEKPEIIYDFGGFPDELFRVKYPAPGSPSFAREAKNAVTLTAVQEDKSWGLDHGAWTILKHLYPQADIPVFEFSLDYTKPPEYHYKLAKELNVLRDKGVLIIGSGNIVHNLGMLNWRDPNAKFDWGVEFDTKVTENLLAKNHEPLIHYEKAGRAATLSVPTNEHYLPMLYAAALQQNNESLKFIYEGMEMGSISMRCFRVG